MAIKSDLVLALKIHRERTDDAIAERSQRLFLVQSQLAELFHMLSTELSGIGGLELIRTEEPYAFEGLTVELESFRVMLAGQTVSFTPSVVDGTLEVILSNLSAEQPDLRVRKEHGQWIVVSAANVFQSQFSSDFLLSNLVDLVNRS